VTTSGEREVITRLAPRSLRFSVDWLPDGRLLAVDGPRRLLMRLETNRVLTPVADLTSLGDGAANEIVVDSAGQRVRERRRRIRRPRHAGGRCAQGRRRLEVPQRDGAARARPHAGRRRLARAGPHCVRRDLRRIAVRWSGLAELDNAPDGICGHANGAVWVATVPDQRCIRVREGGAVLDTVAVDRGCFACMLGGVDGRTLFIAASEWRGMDALISDGPGLSGQLLAAPGPTRPTRRPSIARPFHASC
jgi:hypothetical protein